MRFATAIKFLNIKQRTFLRIAYRLHRKLLNFSKKKKKKKTKGLNTISIWIWAYVMRTYAHICVKCEFFFFSNLIFSLKRFTTDLRLFSYVFLRFTLLMVFQEKRFDTFLYCLTYSLRAFYYSLYSSKLFMCTAKWHPVVYITHTYIYVLVVVLVSVVGVGVVIHAVFIIIISKKNN